MELDALVTIQFRLERVAEPHSCSVLVHDCLHLMEGSWILEVRHILREGNKCADMLANIAQDSQIDVSMLQEPPTVILPLQADDLEGSTTLRS
ncbi:hypothetical protein REPUB_Repub07fG0166800 [Reevesia pubescens]